MNRSQKGFKGFVIGCPIPRKFFKTKGKGESDYQVHAGSYHVALQEAGIERANIMTYSSILPGIAQEIPADEGMKMINHGAEMKVIQAASHVDTKTGAKRATAAIIYGWLFPKKGGPTAGGLVCEYSEHGTVEEARKNLTACLDGLYRNKDRNGKSFAEDYDLRDVTFIFETVEPKKRFATALVALAFVDYFVPVLEQNVVVDAREQIAIEVMH